MNNLLTCYIFNIVNLNIVIAIQLESILSPTEHRCRSGRHVTSEGQGVSLDHFHILNCFAKEFGWH